MSRALSEPWVFPMRLEVAASCERPSQVMVERLAHGRREVVPAKMLREGQRCPAERSVDEKWGRISCLAPAHRSGAERAPTPNGSRSVNELVT